MSNDMGFLERLKHRLSRWRERFHHFRKSPINQRRWANFKANRRGYWSLWLFLGLFTISLFAEFIANDKPFLVKYDGGYYFPVFTTYPETTFGGEFQTEADYRDSFVQNLIKEKDGFMLWPPIRYSYDTINLNLPVPAPAPPSAENLLGSDDQGRDVLARVIYGFRLSALFGLTLTIFASIAGVVAGAVQGFFGGKVDLYFQRFIELWTSLPQLYILLMPHRRGRSRRHEQRYGIFGKAETQAVALARAVSSFPQITDQSATLGQFQGQPARVLEPVVVPWPVHHLPVRRVHRQ